MAVRKDKPPQTSPTFEKMNLERLRRSRRVTDSAERAVQHARKLLEQSRELIDHIRSKPGNRTKDRKVS